MLLHDCQATQQNVSGDAWGTREGKPKRKCVLIVDDEPDHRLVLRTKLEGCGYDCKEAKDGMEALAVLEQTDVHVVLTDLQMPRMDGLQLVKRVTAHTTFKAIPVILVTSQIPALLSSLDERKRIFTVLSKPYEWSKLLTAVANAIEPIRSSSYETSLVPS